MARSREIIVSIAWYRPQDWERLLKIAADRDKLEDTHAEWVAKANRLIRRLEAEGQPCQRIVVDLDKLIAWCHAKKLPIDGAARSAFVVELAAAAP